jgi:hypothetical protein
MGVRYRTRTPTVEDTISCWNCDADVFRANTPVGVTPSRCPIGVDSTEPSVIVTPSSKEEPFFPWEEVTDVVSVICVLPASVTLSINCTDPGAQVSIDPARITAISPDEIAIVYRVECASTMGSFGLPPPLLLAVVVKVDEPQPR